MRQGMGRRTRTYRGVVVGDGGTWRGGDSNNNKHISVVAVTSLDSKASCQSTYATHVKRHSELNLLIVIATPSPLSTSVPCAAVP